MLLAIYLIFLIFLLAVCFWLVSMIVSSLTDAPFVVTNDHAYLAALDLAKPRSGELIYDLGCGDARVLIGAVKKYDLFGIGFDISPYCIIKSRYKVWLNKLTDKITIYQKSLDHAELEKADIIYLYLTNRILDRIEKDLFARIKPSCRVVTVAFAFKNHKPVKTSSVRQLGRTTTANLYRK